MNGSRNYPTSRAVPLPLQQPNPLVIASIPTDPTIIVKPFYYPSASPVYLLPIIPQIIPRQFHIDVAQIPLPGEMNNKKQVKHPHVLDSNQSKVQFPLNNQNKASQTTILERPFPVQGTSASYSTSAASGPSCHLIPRSTLINPSCSHYKSTGNEPELVTISDANGKLKAQSSSDSKKEEYKKRKIIQISHIGDNEICISNKILALREQFDSLRAWEDTSFGREYTKNRYNSIFTLMSYNILAQQLIDSHRELYTNCYEEHLSWQYRWCLIRYEIKKMNPDILTLQEVQNDHYNDYIKPWFNNLGYEGIYKKRMGDKHDGCAIFFSKNKFKLIEYLSVEYRQPNTFLDRDNVGLICKLEDIHTKVPICLATTHLLFNPKRHDIKLCQLQILLAEIERISYMGFKEEPYCPTIITGDFNSLPHSPLLKFLNGGFLKYYGASPRDLIQYPKSAYGKVLKEELMPPDLGISDNCQHNSVMEMRNRGINTNISLERRREIEYNNVHLYHTERKGGSYSQRMLGNQCTGKLSHPLHIKSVYRHKLARLNGEEEVTTGVNFETVDYIMYSQVYSHRHKTKIEGNLKLLSRHGLLGGSEVKESGSMPSAICPSDHFPLAAKFVLMSNHGGRR